MDDFERIARLAGTMPSDVWRQLASALRRSEPDAREIYGLVGGMRFVARRGRDSKGWRVALERRPQPWERAPRAGVEREVGKAPTEGPRATTGGFEEKSGDGFFCYVPEAPPALTF